MDVNEIGIQLVNPLCDTSEGEPTSGKKRVCSILVFIYRQQIQKRAHLPESPLKISLWSQDGRIVRKFALDKHTTINPSTQERQV